MTFMLVSDPELPFKQEQGVLARLSPIPPDYKTQRLVRACIAHLILLWFGKSCKNRVTS